LGKTVSVQIRINDPNLLADLVASFERACCRVEAMGQDLLEVSSPSALLTTAQARREIGFYLATWQIRHPGARAEFVD
jgi:hypothetical protein